MADEFSREVALMVDEMVNPKKRSAMLASFAREEIAIAKSQNEAILQRTIRKPKVTVDGQRDAPLSSVQPDGTIVAEFNAEANVIRWILRQLEQESPRLSGAYKESHTVFADGVEMELRSSDDAIPDAEEFVIASDLPYAIKLDPKDGLPARSRQAPDGIYAVTAAVAAKRFDGEATVRFSYRDIPMKGGGMHRNPAIVVRPGR